ncbi:efflux RND transporter periplasmic adaptor subunit [Ruegeria sp. R13_0]|uniref:efflux RND transporter periplasmic adaptor subunit n=1 Tax=Ruegeria sp. R13_0 TaxID=2821099 RepID=UPI001AD9E0D5|nr:efflux RND transporter periplasmic adaptor subunit [Ruegeria sp. R13_0]MBO9436658.1 efflux RND transporter periplasmic adaptor subunit [Ruegeria sp. R13_0]
MRDSVLLSTRRVVHLGSLALLLAACLPEEDTGQTQQQETVRGLITTLVSDAEDVAVRRYPGVLEPSEVNLLSFEVGGRLGRLSLDVGERVAEGQLLAQLETDQFETTIDNRKAVVEEVRVTLAQAERDLARSETLLERGAVTVVRRDEDATTVAQVRAQLTQAEKDLAAAEQDLSDSKLFAPFDGIVDALEVDSFATVSSGQTVLSLYQQEEFEVSFSVSFDVVGQLVVGTPATIRLADDPSISLSGVVSELGERAGQVSSFPVVVRLKEIAPIIKAGMAVEVALEFPLLAARGHLLPMSAVIPGTEIPKDTGPNDAINLEVYVFEPETNTVQRRTVTMAGIRENSFLIIDGLSPGERVATKGVAFLRDGMEVALLPNDGDGKWKP